MKYNVHIFAVVRVKAKNIEAETAAEAAERAENSLDLNEILNNNGVEYAEDIAYFAVDPLLPNGQVNYKNTLWLKGDYSPLKD